MMEAGRELDELVADKVMSIKREVRIAGTTDKAFIYTENPYFGGVVQGFEINRNYCQPLPYSTSIEAAWQVVEKLRKSHCCLTLKSDFDHVWECYAIKDEDDPEHHSDVIVDYKIYEKAETAPLAICLAALKAVGVEAH